MRPAPPILPRPARPCAAALELTRRRCVCVRGAVFVALMKQYVLRDELKPHMWAGVIIIALAVCLVGASPMIDDKEDDAEEGGGGDDQLPLGLLLTIGGTFMQSLQYVYEEKMMSGDTKVCACPWLFLFM